ncbi:MAG: ACP S-malonyltransferase, partial [Desulfovibrio sp.]|nr:ACP S-malonyltransferase [Desulfovibrio sp.]
SGLSLRGIYWDGDAAAMAETRNLQPALTVVNLALWRGLAPKTRPSAAAGHSLGEYSALAAAGVLPVDAVLELVSLRGRLMSEADPQGNGAMAAIVKLPLETVRQCVEAVEREGAGLLLVANYNTPAQFVVSGEKSAVEAVQEKVKAARGRAIVLPVSGAFHSPMMAEAAAELASAIDALSKSAWSKAAFPVYCNADPKARTDAESLKSLLKRQMTSPVYWIETIGALWDDGCRAFVECGPKGVLGKMVGPILSAHGPAAPADGVEELPWRVLTVGNERQLLEFSMEQMP